MKLLLALALSLLLVPAATATITLDITDEIGAYTPFQSLMGQVTLSFNELVLQSSTLFASIDDQSAPSLPLQEYVNPPSSYSFVNQPFAYNVSAVGTNTYTFFPDQSFPFDIFAEGTCGGDYCYDGQQDLCECPEGCGPPYPCVWASSVLDLADTVNGNEGLKFVFDAQSSIEEPPSNNNNTFWSSVTDNSLVTLTNRKACGGEQYETRSVSSEGWVIRSLQPDIFTIIPGTSPTEAETTIEPFDNASLTDDRFLFNPTIPGGIYKNIEYQNYGTEAIWDGETGYIRIINYVGTPNTYSIIYLPPNGPRVCAFTDFEQQEAEDWVKATTLIPSPITFINPYSRTYSDIELESIVPPPPCPQGSQNCTQTTHSYDVIDLDTLDTVTISWDPNTVSASTSSTELVQIYTSLIPLSAFSNLRAPSPPGNHTLSLSLDGLASGELAFATCIDADLDGFCQQTVDCDDSDPTINPNGVEVCDGRDNDCDGDIDEDFWGAGSKLGNPCGVGICSGIFVCSPDGEEVVCNNKYFPGEFPEYCGDGFDNDCDGIIDEALELVQGQQATACVCKEGNIKSCGSNIGACQEGIQQCKNGMWEECKNQIPPSVETCNTIDDNCDGVVDNVGGGSSVSSSACQCFGGSPPSAETCNDIDDDCDGRLDEGLTCCQDGQTRTCGKAVGACREGTQTCVGGSWGVCQGGRQPSSEVCFTQIDENCDGRVNEGCEQLEEQCQNSIQDPGEGGVDCGGQCPNSCAGIFGSSATIAGIVILLIIVVAFLQFRAFKPT